MRAGVKTVRSVLDFLWPEFVEFEGLFFLATTKPSSPQLAALLNNFNGSRTEVESFQNHCHIADYFKNGFELKKPLRRRMQDGSSFEETYYDDQHPDFALACDIGRNIAKMWCCKLREQFPSTRFRVYYTERDNPIVRFHAVRKGENVWLDDTSRQKVSGEALVFDTARCPTSAAFRHVAGART